MNIITALRQVSHPEPIDLSGASRAKKVALAVFAVLTVLAIGGAIFYVLKNKSAQEPLPQLKPPLPPANPAAFAEVIKQGDINGLLDLLEDPDHSIDPNMTDEDGIPLLCLAIKHFRVIIKNLTLEREAEATYPFAMLNILTYSDAISKTMTDCNGRGPLHYAAEYNDAAFGDLLDQGECDVNAQDCDGNTVLHLLAKKQMDQDLLRRLENAGADINIQNHAGKTPLFLAVESKDRDLIFWYASRPKCNFHLKDAQNNTFLHLLAKQNESYGIVTKEWLQKHQVKVDEKNNAGKTPLSYALNNNNRALFSLLAPFQSNSDVFNQDELLKISCGGWRNNLSDGWERISVTSSDSDRSITEDFVHVENDAKSRDYPSNLVIENANLTDENGNNSMHLAVLSNTKERVQALCDYLQEHPGALDINALNKEGYTPLLLAAENNKLNAFEVLVHNAQVDLTIRRKGYDVKHYARMSKMFQLLVEKGVDLNEQDSEGNTLLHWAAAIEKDAQRVRGLVAHVDVNIQNHAGETALILAAKKQAVDVMPELITTGHPDLNLQDNLGNTALHYVAKFNLRSMLIYFQLGEADFRKLNKDGESPVRFALRYHQVRLKDGTIHDTHTIVQEILKYTTSANKVEDLLNAAESGDLDTCKKLIEKKKIDVNAADPITKKTALHHAIIGGHYDVVKYLIEGQNADIEACNYLGWTPLITAGYYAANRSATRHMILFYLEQKADKTKKAKIKGEMCDYKAAITKGCLALASKVKS